MNVLTIFFLALTVYMVIKLYHTIKNHDVQNGNDAGKIKILIHTNTKNMPEIHKASVTINGRKDIDAITNVHGDDQTIKNALYEISCKIPNTDIIRFNNNVCDAYIHITEEISRGNLESLNGLVSQKILNILADCVNNMQEIVVNSAKHNITDANFDKKTDTGYISVAFESEQVTICDVENKKFSKSLIKEEWTFMKNLKLNGKAWMLTKKRALSQ